MELTCLQGSNDADFTLRFVYHSGRESVYNKRGDCDNNAPTGENLVGKKISRRQSLRMGAMAAAATRVARQNIAGDGETTSLGSREDDLVRR